MKMPIWVWDKKQKKYLALPPGLQQFSDGWGYTYPNYWDDNETRQFIKEHEHLFHFKGVIHLWEQRIILKNPGPAKYQPRADKAKITKVQR